MNGIFKSLEIIFMLAIPISIIAFIYALIKKKRKKPFLKIIAACIALEFFSLIGDVVTQSPEQRAEIQQKIAEEKAAKAKAEEEKKAAEVKAEEERIANEKKLADIKAEQEKLAAEKAAAEQKEAEEKAALQKKYDDQKKYEEWLAWQEQQKQQEAAKAQEEQEINSIVSAYALTLNMAIDESDNTWNKGWSLIMDSYNSGDIPTCVPAIVTLNKAMDKYYREMLNFPNVDKKVPENQSKKLKECKEYVENYIEIRLNTTAKFGEYFKKNDLNRLSDIQMNIVNSMVNDGNNAKNDAINMINSLNN